jgi:hypothetical protein
MSRSHPSFPQALEPAAGVATLALGVATLAPQPKPKNKNDTPPPPCRSSASWTATGTCCSLPRSPAGGDTWPGRTPSGALSTPAPSQAWGGSACCWRSARACSSAAGASVSAGGWGWRARGCAARTAWHVRWRGTLPGSTRWLCPTLAWWSLVARREPCGHGAPARQRLAAPASHRREPHPCPSRRPRGRRRRLQGGEPRAVQPTCGTTFAVPPPQASEGRRAGGIARLPRPGGLEHLG